MAWFWRARTFESPLAWGWFGHLTTYSHVINLDLEMRAVVYRANSWRFAWIEMAIRHGALIGSIIVHQPYRMLTLCRSNVTAQHESFFERWDCRCSPVRGHCEA